MRAPSVRLRRSKDRGFEDFGWADNWMTFSFSGYVDPAWNNFGPLRVMIENDIQPHSGFPAHPHRDVEIVTYVAAGTLTHGDNFGHEAGITAGEMQHISAGSRGMVHSEENKHDTVEHNYQMWLIPDRSPTDFAYHQLKFSPEERQGRLRLYCSPDGRDESMPMNCDAFIYAGLFSEGDTHEYHVAEGRGVWLQLVRGEVRLPALDLNLESGDGVGIEKIDGLAMTFDADTEVLLFDVNMNAPLLWK